MVRGIVRVEAADEVVRVAPAARRHRGRRAVPGAPAARTKQSARALIVRTRGERQAITVTRRPPASSPISVAGGRPAVQPACCRSCLATWRALTMPSIAIDARAAFRAKVSFLPRSGICRISGTRMPCIRRIA
jgi:hypothetical protein